MLVEPVKAGTWSPACFLLLAKADITATEGARVRDWTLQTPLRQTVTGMESFSTRDEGGDRTCAGSAEMASKPL